MSPPISDLDASQAQRLLEGHHVGRLTCHGPGGAASVPVTYCVRDHDHVCVEAAGPCCVALTQRHVPVRLEVDEIEGPTRWSTVIGWGFVEDAEAPCGGAYNIRLTAIRGFYRGRLRTAL